jgi:trehalose 6-phosphate synthase
MQIVAPSRQAIAEYRELQSFLEGLLGRINGRFGTFELIPIRYINRPFSHAQLAALYRVLRVGLVTPLRDGMNMVAKEYVAAQDPTDPGVLVLSRFAGAAEELADALQVNPYGSTEVAVAIRVAVAMTLAERQFRWQSMMRDLESHDVHRLRRLFLDDLAATERPATRQVAAA